MSDLLYHVNTLVFFIAAVISVSCLWSLLRRKSNAHPLPPGPRQFPIIGNAHQLPGLGDHMEYRRLRKAYGDLVHFSVVGRHVLILNSRHVVSDLFGKQGHIYSSRPTPEMSKMTGLDKTWALLPYGDSLRYFRKLGRHVMDRHAVAKYEFIQTAEARSFVNNIFDTSASGDLLDLIDRAVSSSVLRIMYGYSPSPELDDVSAAGRQISHEARKLVDASSQILDLLPFLKYAPRWLPLLPFHRRAETLIKLRDHIFNTPFNMVKNEIEAAMSEKAQSPANSICATLLLEGLNGQPGSAGSEHSVKMFIGSIYPPSQETTAATIYMFFLLMGNHPDIQMKAREEIVSVVGENQLPEFSHLKSFVYLMAVFKEVLRFHTVTPFALPHTSDAELIYKGYRIPKGTITFANTWEILHDPDIYANPLDFIPERFLDMKEGPAGHSTDPRDYVFGYGRRICPGSYMAENTILIFMATILATCDIGPCTNPDGSKFEKYQFVPEFVARPFPFKCSITPRIRDLL